MSGTISKRSGNTANRMKKQLSRMGRFVGLKTKPKGELKVVSSRRITPMTSSQVVTQEGLHRRGSNTENSCKSRNGPSSEDGMNNNKNGTEKTLNVDEGATEKATNVAAPSRSSSSILLGPVEKHIYVHFRRAPMDIGRRGSRSSFRRDRSEHAFKYSAVPIFRGELVGITSQNAVTAADSQSTTAAQSRVTIDEDQHRSFSWSDDNLSNEDDENFGDYQYLEAIEQDVDEAGASNYTFQDQEFLPQEGEEVSEASEYDDDRAPLDFSGPAPQQSEIVVSRRRLTLAPDTLPSVPNFSARREPEIFESTRHRLPGPADLEFDSEVVEDPESQAILVPDSFPRKRHYHSSVSVSGKSNLDITPRKRQYTSGKEDKGEDLDTVRRQSDQVLVQASDPEAAQPEEEPKPALNQSESITSARYRAPGYEPVKSDVAPLLAEPEPKVQVQDSRFILVKPNPRRPPVASHCEIVQVAPIIDWGAFAEESIRLMIDVEMTERVFNSASKKIISKGKVNLPHKYCTRPLFKYCRRRVTGNCELKRIWARHRESAFPRHAAIEACLIRSKRPTIKRLLVDLRALVRHGQFDVYTVRMTAIREGTLQVMGEKGIDVDENRAFVEGFEKSLHVIWSFKYLGALLERSRSTPFDSANDGHEAKLLQIWDNIFPNERLKGRISQQWKLLGFQNVDPSTDLRGAGYLGIECLHYFTSEHSSTARRLVAMSSHQKFGFPFACVSIQITYWAVFLTTTGVACTHFYNAMKTLAESDFAVYNSDTHINHEDECNAAWKESLGRIFYEFYTALFTKFLMYWIESKPQSIMDYGRVKKKFENMIVKELLKPSAMFLFEDLEEAEHGD